MQKNNCAPLERIHNCFRQLYPQQAQNCIRRMEMLLGRYGLGRIPGGGSPYRWSQKDAVLITYGDTLRNESEIPLCTLHGFLRNHLKDVINTVHILPFSPYSSDDGFSVIDYRSVNPELGAWSDIRSVAAEFRLMSDLVINHVSRESRWFRDYVQGLMPERHYFIEADPADDLSAVVRPRSLPLLTPVHTRDGLRHVWTTFSDDQIDLDFSNPDVLFEFLDIIMFYAASGVRLIRLDAIAYLWKTKGTGCIHLPETHVVVKLIRSFLDMISPETSIITETNVPHEENISYFGQGDQAHMVYQFPLAPLLLHAIISGNCQHLTGWADGLAGTELPSPCTFLNFTASHDGIGLRPLEGLITGGELEKLIEQAGRRGGKVSARDAGDGTEKPYELNITYFDAVSDPDRGDASTDINRFLCSQAVALSLRGVPAIYIHSLLGTKNDYQAVETTGRARSINRSKLHADEIEMQLSDRTSTRCQVFRRYRRLLHCRTQHRAFHPEGKQNVLDLSPQVFALERRSPDGEEAVLCLFNLGKDTVTVTLPEDYAKGDRRDIITGKLQDESSKKQSLKPFKPLWLAT